MGKADTALAAKAKAKVKGKKGKRKASTDASVPEFTTERSKDRGVALVLYTEPGFGKTSTAAFADKPKIIMGAGETGYETLLDYGRVPAVPHVVVERWTEYMGVLKQLADEPDCDVLAIDTLGAVERLCHEHVCNRDFGGDWSDSGFLGYQRGFVQA